MNIYGIWYYNGMEHDDHWEGLLGNEFFDTPEKAESRIVELQTEYSFEQQSENARWYDNVPTWEVQIITVK